MRRLALVALVAATVGSAADATSGAAPCEARVELEPSRAFVDQQVLYRLSIRSRDDVTDVEWLEPPSFPGFRAERLPGTPAPSAPEPGDERVRIRVEERALFPERPGELTVRSPGLRCRVGSGAGAHTATAAIPDAVLRVAPLPEEGRPAGFTGLVGAVGLRADVVPRALELGGSVRVDVLLHGRGNLWDASDPLPADALGAVEIFRERPTLELEPGVALFVRRRFRYQLVPREPGIFSLPPLRVIYFDPESERYTHVESPAAAVRVTPRTSEINGP